MPNTLIPETLKTLRDQKQLTQEALAKLCKCTPETVGRWERGASKIKRKDYKSALCNALGVTWAVLCRPCQPDNETKAPRAVDDGREEILRNLNARVSHHAHLAFTLASQRYGVRIADIVELAPLLFMIVAEQSLADRADKIGALNNTLSELESLRDELPQFSGIIYEPYELGEIAMREQQSIKRREVFGHEHWQPLDWHAPDIDPFANYLKRLVESMNFAPELIEFIGPGVWETPPYQLALDALKEITGLTGETEQERTALHHINNGRPEFRELSAKKKSLSASDFQEWLKAQADSVDEFTLD